MQPYHFKTNTLLKNLVGKDLINDDDIAIVELVKNSYDAGSPDVVVRFEGMAAKASAESVESRIVIVDNGSGMDLSDIVDKWLNIAYSEKKLTPQENGVYYAGNKGVGRFSCDRLGTRLNLITRKLGGDILSLPIFWQDFEVEGQKDRIIQDIPLYINAIAEAEACKVSGLNSFPIHGTVLVISELRGGWGRERLLELKRSFEKFLNPNQLFQRDAFSITLEVPEYLKSDEGQSYYSRVNGPVQNQIFEKLKFKSTYIDCSISSESKTVTTNLYHEGELVFKVVEESSVYESLDDVNAIVYYLNPYKKAYFTRQAGVRSIEFGSIFLFLNGFRVAPYGDRGDDWLKLDVRKTQGTTRYLSSRDVVGRIEIFDKNNSFEPVSSREGLKNTDSFKFLRESFFLDVLRKLERFVVEGLDWDSVPFHLRDELRKSDGLDWNNTSEQYVESWDRKQQRIALSIMTLIGSNPSKTINFWFNPALLEGVYETKTEEVQKLLSEIEGDASEKIDGDLKKSLSRIRGLIAKKDEEAKVAKVQVVELKIAAAQQHKVVEKLESEKETYRAQTLFLQSVAPTEVKDLVVFHHQINHDSTIVGNYLAKAIKGLNAGSSVKTIIEFLEKAEMANRRMAAVAQFASKANFRSGMKKEVTDIPAFIEQYLINVSKDFTGAGVNITVSNSVHSSFELRASRIELSILIDNIVNNAVKAHSKRLDVSIEQVGANNLKVKFSDFGRGLSSEISDIDDIFHMGVTTTSGSGLGLFHARRIAESIDGKLTAMPNTPRGLTLVLELIR